MKRRALLLYLLAAAVLLATLTALELTFLGPAGLSSYTRLPTYLFINFVVLALIVLMTIVGRTFVDLYRAKKRQAAGYRFRTKLVTIFVLLVSVPSILLFVLTSRMVSGTVEQWFSIRAEVPLKSSVAIASHLYDRERQRVLERARWVVENGGTDVGLPPLEDVTVRVIEDPVAGTGTDLVRRAFAGEAGTEIDVAGHDEVVRAVVPQRNDDGQVHQVVVVETTLPNPLVQDIRLIRMSFENYKGLESTKSLFQSGYSLVLALITAFVIVITLLAALRVARSITDPVQALAEGTRKVAEGRFNTTLDVSSDDELGQLTSAFNEMVNELKGGQERLKEAYADVDSKRLILEGIMSNIRTGVICLDTTGGVLTINNAACRVLGIQPRDLSGLTYREILDQVESNELREILRNLRKRDFTGKTWELTASVRGNPVILRLFLSNLRSPEGDPVGILVVFDDITRVVQAQRAQAWQEVARRMTHEIKNPLTPIKLSAERLLKKHRDGATDLDEILESSLATITREVEALRKLVNEFSRFGRLPRLALEPIDLGDLVRKVVPLYDAYKDLTIDVHAGKNLPPVEVDPEQIRRALINLIDNAVASVGADGRIEVQVEYDSGSRRTRLVVADNGEGIAKENRDHLFLPHFSTKKTGTGLGLAIVHKIVTDHNGTIRVEENHPRGARFVLELPTMERV